MDDDGRIGDYHERDLDDSGCGIGLLIAGAVAAIIYCAWRWL